MTALLEAATNNSDNGSVTFKVFHDLAEAFDTIDHDILLEKLSLLAGNTDIK